MPTLYSSMNDHKAHSCNYHQEQGLANISCKRPGVKVLGFADIWTLSLYFVIVKALIDNSKQKYIDVFLQNFDKNRRQARFVIVTK